MGIWKRARLLGRLSKEAADLKGSYPMEWSLGEEAGIRYFKDLQEASVSGGLGEHGLERLPSRQEEVRLYLVEYANARSMNEFLQKRGTTNQRALQAFGIAFGTTLGDLLLGERRLES